MLDELFPRGFEDLPRMPAFRGKLCTEDVAELERVTPEKLDGVLWVDRCRVSKERGRYVLRDTVTNEVLSRHDLIDSALAEAKRHNRERFL